jgi:outer membrane receptor protein involved in Fe transport
MISFAVDDHLASTDPAAAKSGVAGAHQLSPKASLIVTPIDSAPAQVDLYLNYGHGFHSNDVRGVFAEPSVTPLARAIGAEAGARARLFQRWDLAVAFWQLQLATETVWEGDAGTTSVSGATHRSGVEIETRYEFTPWLAAAIRATATAWRWHPSRRGPAGFPRATRWVPASCAAACVSTASATGPLPTTA